MYAIGPEVGPPLKIGVTAASVRNRLYGIQSSIWFDLRIFWAVKIIGSAAAVSAERSMHDAFAASKVRGEWFAVTPGEARIKWAEIAQEQGIPFEWSDDYDNTRSFDDAAWGQR